MSTQDRLADSRPSGSRHAKATLSLTRDANQSSTRRIQCPEAFTAVNSSLRLERMPISIFLYENAHHATHLQSARSRVDDE